MPAVANVNLKVPEVAMLPLSNDFAMSVTVCGAVSKLVQVTIVPALTVREAGEKAKFLILTVFAACPGGTTTGVTPDFEEQLLNAMVAEKIINEK